VTAGLRRGRLRLRAPRRAEGAPRRRAAVRRDGNNGSERDRVGNFLMQIKGAGDELRHLVEPRERSCC
jgi:hypothetical protein